MKTYSYWITKIIVTSLVTIIAIFIVDFYTKNWLWCCSAAFLMVFFINTILEDWLRKKFEK